MLDEMRKHDVESNHVFLLTDAVQLFSLLEQGATSVSAAIHYEVLSWHTASDSIRRLKWPMLFGT